MLDSGIRSPLSCFRLVTMKDPELRKYFEQRLLRWRQELLAQASSSIGEKMRVRSEQRSDPSDLASMESERNLLLRFRDRERKLISKIDSSLLRLREGTYGLCDSCGEEISRRRLEARPVATLCIRCKEEQERQEG